MIRKPTVTIGIPAYNEEANIRHVLSDLLRQKKQGFKLVKIIVISDQSTDDTVGEINKVKSKVIKLIENSKRLGQGKSQNKIIKKTTGDILVLLNADVVIKDKLFIKKLISPIISKKADFTSGNIFPLRPRNYFEKILYVSVLLKKDINKKINNGDNVLTCHGPARAFSKKYYSNFSFKTSVGEDAYSYFWGKSRGFIYKYVVGAILNYKLPENFKDHENQSIRFLKSEKLMEENFGKGETKSYRLPVGIAFKYLLKHLIKNPIEIVVYIAIHFLIKIRSVYKKSDERWVMSTSSKVLRL